jgi:hypothetical protein
MVRDSHGLIRANDSRDTTTGGLRTSLSLLTLNICFTFDMNTFTFILPFISHLLSPLHTSQRGDVDLRLPELCYVA